MDIITTTARDLWENASCRVLVLCLAIGFAPFALLSYAVAALGRV